MVATQHHLATEAAIDTLRLGGSAADAAVAAAAVLTVVDPRSTGLGGDLFALYWTTKGGGPEALASAGVAPQGLSVEALLGAGHTTMPTAGPWSVTVPGAPAGWQALLRRHGALDIGRVLAPAIALARDGAVVSPAVAREWTTAVPKLLGNAAAAATFLVDGVSPAEGARLTNPDLAGTLERFVREGAAPCYEGDLAARIAEAVQELGGPLTSEDLRSWTGPEWLEPISARFHGLDVYEMPPPVQGLVVLEALRIYEGLAAQGRINQEHATIESLKLAFDDANEHMADPLFSPVDVARLLSEGHIQARRSLISPGQVLPGNVGRPSDTVFVSVATEDVGSCSLIQSVYDGFGSGIVVPGTGMALQNRGSGFYLHPTHPNRPEPGKRPLHTILPAMLGNGGQFRGCLGVVGGYMQPQGQVQVLRNHLELGMTPQEAVDAPRFRVYKGRRLSLEAGYDQTVAEGLRERGHEIEPLDPFECGGAQLIVRDERGFQGGSDRRKDGAVAVL
jgi:gamma-glutamyltranspeptidase/glutathione hydrolase